MRPEPAIEDASGPRLWDGRRRHIGRVFGARRRRLDRAQHGRSAFWRARRGSLPPAFQVGQSGCVAFGRRRPMGSPGCLVRVMALCQVPVVAVRMATVPCSSRIGAPDRRVRAAKRPAVASSA